MNPRTWNLYCLFALGGLCLGVGAVSLFSGIFFVAGVADEETKQGGVLIAAGAACRIATEFMERNNQRREIL